MIMDRDLDTLNPQAETVVGPSVNIQGDLISEGNIRIEGAVNGKVKTSQSVQVGEAARITADVSAGNAIIAGEIQGNLKISGSLVLSSTARVLGDIACSILRVEDGAQFTGKCAMQGIQKDGSGKVVKQIEPEPED
jgi:cytoskeletal protein CcmA (bactofilin family)